MNFKNTSFRMFRDDSKIPYDDIRKMTLSPLILIKPDGRSTFASGRGEKDELVEAFNEDTDLMLFVWAGKWRSDVFRLYKSDLE